MMPKESLVSVIITTRNRKRDILECLDTLYKQSYKNLEIILADNNSEDDTLQSVSERFPDVNIVVAKRNLGIAGGRNLAQREAKGYYYFYLDSDTILHEDCIKELVNFLSEHKDVGMVVPKMYYFDYPDHIWFAGSTIDLFTSRTINFGTNEKDVGQYDEPRECAHGPTAFMVTKEVVDIVRGHDETYFMTYADADFAVRTKKAGFKIFCVPSAKLWHRLNMEENRSGIRALGYNLPLRAYYFSRNRVLFMKKNSSAAIFAFFLLFIFPLFTIYYTLKIIQYKGKFIYLKNHLIGSWDGLKYALFNHLDNTRFN
ncbi:MAG: hypothetical protein A2Y66_00775 [Nitrospirae bacterium RBG_13_41_22]|jgi:GT2 family glycosyltransferase|nr:MAG: hypothetical protein A2Y66_00775 [Nitrospirae bacterium RBG_13_41_22]